MKTWRLVSGILCCALSAYIVFQSLAAGVLIAITQSSDHGASAGMIVSLLVLAAGIVSITTRKGGKGSNITLLILFALASIIAFMSAKVYQDLMVWGGWCAVCGIIAIINFVTGYGEPE